MRDIGTCRFRVCMSAVVCGDRLRPGEAGEQNCMSSEAGRECTLALVSKGDDPAQQR